MQPRTLARTILGVVFAPFVFNIYFLRDLCGLCVEAFLFLCDLRVLGVEAVLFLRDLSALRVEAFEFRLSALADKYWTFVCPATADNLESPLAQQSFLRSITIHTG